MSTVGIHQPLTEANAREHAAQLELYEQLLEAATRLDFGAVSACVDLFEARLMQHMGFEEDMVLASFRRHCPGDDAELARIEGDHLILRRTLASVRRALMEIESADAPRRELVRRLGILHRLADVLEHHTLRESTHLYPRLDEGLPPGLTEALCQGMNSAMPADDAASVADPDGGASS